MNLLCGIMIHDYEVIRAGFNLKSRSYDLAVLIVGFGVIFFSSRCLRSACRQHPYCVG